LPGEDVRTRFNIEVDPDATAKTYSIKAEIEYEDAEGQMRISDIIYVPAQVRDQEEGKGIFGNPYLLGAGLIVIAALIFIYMKRREGGGGSEH